MYYYIKGILAKKTENYVVVDAGGVGYLINTSLTSITNVGDTGSDVTMYTYLHVREDVMDLYGFTTIEEKNMFLHLLSVSGVGPKAALAVLSIAPPAKFAIAVVTNDTKAITKAQGVGPKMAQRIILELKDKLKNEDLDIPAEDSEAIASSDTKSEAINALIVLGYSASEAQTALRGVDASLSVEDMIKQALSKLF